MTDQSSIRIFPVGMALGAFLAVTFVLCVLFGLLFPSATMYQVWLPLLPGVSWISWPSALLGLVESFAYGWYIAVIFIPVLNYFTKKALPAS
jgi:uncharacterized protein DUF5676